MRAYRVVSLAPTVVGYNVPIKWFGGQLTIFNLGHRKCMCHGLYWRKADIHFGHCPIWFRSDS